jgi:hypothetical protein
MFDRVMSLIIEKAYAVDELAPTTPNTANNAPKYTGLSGINDGIGQIGGNIASILALVAGGVAILFLIYYGILYITSQGNPDKTKLARAGIINAIVGIIIITAAYGIIRLASSIGQGINGTIPGSNTHG